MSGHFLYQPHVHRDGKVTTPDLLLTRATVLDATGDAAPLPIDRIAMTVTVQQVGADAHGLAALAVVAARDGALLTLASLHAAPAADGADFLACLKPISREAWRLDDVLPHMAELRLQAWHLTGGDGGARRNPALETGIPEEVADQLRAAGASALAGSLMLVGLRREKAPPETPTGFAAQLDDPVLGRQIGLSYAIEHLG